MSQNSSSPPRSKPQPLKETVKYTEESHPMRLDEALEYFSRCIAKVFLVTEGVYCPKGRQRVAKGE